MPSGVVSCWRAVSMAPHTPANESCPALSAVYKQQKRSTSERRLSACIAAADLVGQKRISIAAKPRNHRQLRNYSEVHRAKSLVGIADALHQRPERRLQKFS